MTDPILKVEGLSTGYGDIRALWDVDVDVWPGEITVVLGHNGAGKTTLLSAIAGLLPAKSGSIRFDGEPLNKLSADKRSRRGLALVQEGKRVFRQQSLEANLILGATSLRRSEIKPAVEAVYERFPILFEKRKLLAGSLSGGQQQMLAIGQALMPNPRVVMLDEPSAGLAPIIFEEVMRATGKLREEGIGVLLVEQLVDKVSGFADHTVHLRNGRVSQPPQTHHREPTCTAR